MSVLLLKDQLAKVMSNIKAYLQLRVYLLQSLKFNQRYFKINNNRTLQSLFTVQSRILLLIHLDAPICIT